MRQNGTTLVLVPAYKPDERLVALCGELRQAGLDVLVVDDGSGASYATFFEQVQTLGCYLERHAVNMGKGRALKTGINAALNRFEALFGLITADADGQHTCTDIMRIVDAMHEQPEALVLGSRAFTGNVPFKSRAGNAITRYVYRFVTGIRCHDTQTGLRGIPADALGKVLVLPGERYEYEMNMLLRLRDMNLPLHEVEIETIYIDDNKGSHFHPFRDAVRIYSVILRFMLSSLVSAAIEYGLFLCLMLLKLQPWMCYAIGRIVSSVINYTLNRTAVFGGKGGSASILRYYLLATVQLAVGAALVEFFHMVVGLDATWFKIVVDAALFFVSYIVQRDFVFSNRWKRKSKIATE